MSMLHFALHKHGLDLQVKHNEDPNADDFYDLQIDPTMLLLRDEIKSRYNGIVSRNKWLLYEEEIEILK